MAARELNPLWTESVVCVVVGSRIIVRMLDLELRGECFQFGFQLAIIYLLFKTQHSYVDKRDPRLNPVPPV